VHAVDGDHAPAVAVADLVNLLNPAVVCAGFDGQAGVVAAAPGEALDDARVVIDWRGVWRRT
jgi:hypothetical protein